jgi:hypothetical protein
LQAFADEYQTLEDLARKLYGQRWPLTAIGVQLDILGRIVVFDRPASMTDSEYRLFILAKIYANRMIGTIEEFNHLLSLCQQTEYYVFEMPTGFMIVVTDIQYFETVLKICGFAKPGGVVLDFVFSEDDADNTFRFSNTYSSDEVNANAGWGSSYVANTVGGSFAGARRLA